MELSTHKHQTIDTVTRYGWKLKDQPGKLKMLHKDALSIDADYQRDALTEKVRQIAANWSWLSLGALVVGERDGQYFVIDGQHRLLAAKKRTDIKELPCVVFETADVKTEARGFLDLNTGRKPVSAFGKQKALVAAGDELASFVHNTCKELGIEVVSSAHAGKQLRCISLCIRRAGENRAAFSRVLRVAAGLSMQDNVPITDKLLDGLLYIHMNCGQGLDDKRLVKRLYEKGTVALLEAAHRAAVFYTRGGAKVWATGMLEEINKNLRNKFTMENGVDKSTRTD